MVPNMICFYGEFGPHRDEVTGQRRRLHNEELYDLYSPNIILVIKSRIMRCFLTISVTRHHALCGDAFLCKELHQNLSSCAISVFLPTTVIC
jgi:hypothetical protein